MIAAGWSVPRVAAELGHRDPAMTLRIYAHLWPAEFEHGRNQLDAAIARLAGPPADQDAARSPRKWDGYAVNGSARGETRTRAPRDGEGDFKSPASTSSATRAARIIRLSGGSSAAISAAPCRMSRSETVSLAGAGRGASPRRGSRRRPRSSAPAPGISPRTSRRSSSGSAASRASSRSTRRAVSTVAVDQLGNLALQPQVDGRQRGDRPGHADQLAPRRSGARASPRRPRRAARRPRRRGGSAVQEPLATSARSRCRG